MKVLTVFIDGLKPESIEYMPFLNTFSTKRRIKTEFGHSNPSHASMYTGVYPNKHLYWFIWKYSPSTSPFKWTKKLKLPDNLYIKYACHRVTQFFNRGCSSFYGTPFLWHMPLKCWHYFDVAEKKFWTEPNYVENYPTIFELLTAHSIQYEIIGMSQKYGHEAYRLIERHEFSDVKPWTDLFLGDIDHLSHAYGQNSPQTRERLKKIDSILEAKYRFFEKQFGDFTFMLFSDHGQIEVKERINPYSIFSSQGESLEDYIYFIDINSLRFWFRDEVEREKVTKILSGVDDKGLILTEEHLKKYNIEMPDNRYGDLIFHLYAPYAFDQGKIVAFGKQWTTPPVTIHGCLPDYPDSDGVFISNRRVVSASYIKLEDIMPSMLHLFNIEIPSYVDGRVLWV